jgi:hypothetical protein
MSNIKDNLALSLPKTQARVLMKSRMWPTLYQPRICLFPSSLKRPARTSAIRINTTRCHDMHPRINQHHQPMVDCLRCLVRPWTIMNTRKSPLSHWRWSFYTSINEVPSLIIKTASISLTNKEEQLSTMLLEDKDNQGGTWVYISNEPQLINQGSRKIKKGWWEKSVQLYISSSLGLEGAKKN